MSPALLVDNATREKSIKDGLTPYQSMRAGLQAKHWFRQGVDPETAIEKALRWAFNKYGEKQ